MTKLIFVNRFFYPDHSATSQLLTDLACHLAKTRTSVYVVTSRQVYNDPRRTLPCKDSMEGVTVIRVWTTRFGRRTLAGRGLDYVTFYLSSLWNLFFVLRHGDVVVAKTDPPLVSVIAAVVTSIRRAKLINWIQDLFPEVAGALRVGGMGSFQGLLRAMRNWSLETAHMNVVIGDGMAERLVAEGIKQNAIQVIHNWSDGTAIRPVDHKKNPLREEWNLQEAFVVGYSGNIGRAHEFGTILDAADMLKSVEKIVFLFIGDGAQRDSIMEAVQSRGLKNVVFRPYQSRSHLTFSLCVPDVHLISLKPALEGLIVPSKFYGIAAAGRPVIFIGGQDGEISRILRKTGSGYTVSVGDFTGLANQILEMLHHPQETMMMGARARGALDQHFDQKHAFAAWERLLQYTNCDERD